MIKLYYNNIVNVGSDVIVNAANKTLLGGSGVDGAIHAAAGRSLVEDCAKLNGCPVGEAKTTISHNLITNGTKFIIHTVAPIYNRETEAELIPILTKCYHESFEQFRKLRLFFSKTVTSIVFPSLGTGACGWPIVLTSEIAIRVALEFEEYSAMLTNSNDISEIGFCLFSAEDLEVYRATLDYLINKGKNV